MLLGFAGIGVVLTMSIGAFFWVNPIEEKGSQARPGDVKKASSAEAASALQSATSEVAETLLRRKLHQLPSRAVTSPPTVPPPPVAAPPVETLVETAPVAVPAPVQPPVGRLLSKAEISALVTRGDVFLSHGDITCRASLLRTRRGCG